MENLRYLRQIGIEGWDQSALEGATIAIVGLGGLGSASAAYLCAAGAGRLILIDDSEVDLSNLNRQVLYTEFSIGTKKVETARARLKAMNQEVDIVIKTERLTDDSANELLSGVDVIVDGLDNFESRFVLNRFSVKEKIPYIYGAVEGWEGFVTLFKPPKTPCLSCIMPGSYKKNADLQVAGVTPGVIGSLQAAEAIKYLMKLESALYNKLLVMDILSMKYDIVDIEKDNSCPICSA
jgi:molybdopterin/thiamine biosynthesis adenylyltransferase